MIPGTLAIRRYIQKRYGTSRGYVRHLLGLLQWQFCRLQGYQRMDPARARRLVFVCLGNINRSAFGQAVAHSLGVPAHSFGLSTSTGSPATPQAILEAKRRGYSLEAHRATSLGDYEYLDGDVLLVMEVRHARQLVQRGYPAGSICFLGLWGKPRRVHLHDPHTLSQAYFQTCFGLIETAVCRLAAIRTGRGS